MDNLTIPLNTHQDLSPQARRRAYATLDAIEEDGEETDNTCPGEGGKKGRDGAQDAQNLPNVQAQETPSGHHMHRAKDEQQSSEDEIELLVSPPSDHFPTPRGIHFLSAPVLPATPSFASSSASESDPGDDDDEDLSSEASSLDPFPHSAAPGKWRESIMTAYTEFEDDIYNASDDDARQKKMSLQARTSSGLSVRRRSSLASQGARGGAASVRCSTRSSTHLSPAGGGGGGGGGGDGDARHALAPFVIPEESEGQSVGVGDVEGSGDGSFAKKRMSIPPEPPATVNLSPTIKSFMEARQKNEVPRISAPPSLDGSLNSDELPVISAPPTPVMGSEDESEDGVEHWTGVRLQPAALETLRALSGNDSDYEPEPDPVIEMAQQHQPREEMAEAPGHRQGRRHWQRLPGLLTAASRRSSISPSPTRRTLAALTRLDIPSPGGFFGNLSPTTRRTWHIQKRDEPQTPTRPPTGPPTGPPTSTTAENFYRAPWNIDLPDRVSSVPSSLMPLRLSSECISATIVENVVNIPADTDGQDLPTAIRLEPTPVTARRVPLAGEQGPAKSGAPAGPTSSHSAEPVRRLRPDSPMEATEIIVSCDPDRARKQFQAALSHLNRTETWLMAQRAYLRGVTDFSEDELTRPELKSPGGGPPVVPPKDMAIAVALTSSKAILPEERDNKSDSNQPFDQSSVASPVARAAAAGGAGAGAAARQKKAVRFSDVVAAPLPRALSFYESRPSAEDGQGGRPQQLHAFRPESAFYRAFTDAAVRRCAPDAFIQRQARFEALQAQRVVLRDVHRDRLLGKYQLSVVERNAAAQRRRMSANVVRGDYHDDSEGDRGKDPEQVRAEAERLRRDKEAEAVSQMMVAAWHVAATKLLNGGRLVAAPIDRRLARRQSWVSVQVNGGGGGGAGRGAAPVTHPTSSPTNTTFPTAVTTTAAGYNDRPRILDLGGQGSCDWGWHAALQWPNAKVYTVTTKAIRQLSNSNIRGPPNHRQVAVERLTRLPFGNDQFDLVSARELHAVLKVARSHSDALAEQRRQRGRETPRASGTTSHGLASDEHDGSRCSADDGHDDGGGGAIAPDDEWDACLRECLRVLKPGGFLEFSVLDADLVNPGPLGHAKAVEFGFVLRTMGYDPAPTRAFLARLQRAGFASVRRAWLCLPAGPRTRSGFGGVGIPPSIRPLPSPTRVLPLSPTVASSEGGKRVPRGLAERPRPREHAASARLPASPSPSPSPSGPNAPPTGSANDIAAVTGLAASWSWERWLLRAGMERAAGELKLQMGSAAMAGGGDALAREAAGGGGGGGMVADVYSVVEEGRARGSAFRMLRGYARKPVPRVVTAVGRGREMQQLDETLAWEMDRGRGPEWGPEWGRQAVAKSQGADDGGMDSPKGSESSGDTNGGDKVMISVVLDTNTLC